MENVWSYLRINKLCAQVRNSYDDILNACRDAWGVQRLCLWQC